MQRNRLTPKTAAEAGDNDLYTMNGARPTGNVNPGDKYEIGGPDQFGETPISTADTAKLHDKDVNDRNDQNIPNLREASEAAIRSAAVLEQKAVRCLVASQRMLPGADQQMIEANAMDLIRLPLTSIDAILARQESFARRLASEAEEASKGDEGKDAPAADPAAPVAPIAPVAAPVMDPAAPVAPVAPAAAPVPAPEAAPVVNPEVPAAPAPEASIDELKNTIQLMASKIAALEEGMKDKKDEDEGAVKFASTAEDTIDSVFAAAQVPASKKGATSLSGMVRQASTAAPESSLESLWPSAPDVSGMF